MVEGTRLAWSQMTNDEDQMSKAGHLGPRAGLGDPSPSRVMISSERRLNCSQRRLRFGGPAFGGSVCIPSLSLTSGRRSKRLEGDPGGAANARRSLMLPSHRRACCRCGRDPQARQGRKVIAPIVRSGLMTAPIRGRSGGPAHRAQAAIPCGAPGDRQCWRSRGNY